MPRSEAALRRRAAKRSRSVDEQRRSDAEHDARKWAAFVAAARGSERRGSDMEPSPACPPSNPAHKVTRGEQGMAVVPKAAAAAAKPGLKPAAPAGSSAWAPQADAARIQANMELRRRYLHSPGELTAEEAQRAAALIARDEKKKRKAMMAPKSKKK
jgi:hypothetical protein